MKPQKKFDGHIIYGFNIEDEENSLNILRDETIIFYLLSLTLSHDQVSVCLSVIYEFSFTMFWLFQFPDQKDI